MLFDTTTTSQMNDEFDIFCVNLDICLTNIAQ